jgi:hypothetical protein
VFFILRHDHSWPFPAILADGYKDRASDGPTIGLNTVTWAGKLMPLTPAGGLTFCVGGLLALDPRT